MIKKCQLVSLDKLPLHPNPQFKIFFLPVFSLAPFFFAQTYKSENQVGYLIVREFLQENPMQWHSKSMIHSPRTLDTGTVNHGVNKNVNSQHITFSVLTTLQNILTSALQ